MVARKETPEEKGFDAAHAEANEVNKDRFSGIAYVTAQMNLALSTVVRSALMECATLVGKAFTANGESTDSSYEILVEARECFNGAQKFLDQIMGTFTPMILEMDVNSPYPPSKTDEGGFGSFLAGFLDAAKRAADDVKMARTNPEAMSGESLVGITVQSVALPEMIGYVEYYQPDTDLYTVHLTSGHNGILHRVWERHDFRVAE